MCYIDAHKKQQPSFVDGSSSGGGNELQPNLTAEVLAQIGATIYFIHCWLK